MTKKKKKVGRPEKEPTAVICQRVPEKHSEALKEKMKAYLAFEIEQLAKSATKKKG